MSLRGAYNRILRRWGRGIPLYFIQKDIVYYSGFDQKDRSRFDMWLGVNVPHLTIIHDVEDDYVTGLMRVIDWMKVNAGLRAVHYNRTKKEYVVGFANANDAFAAKMYFDRVTLMGPRSWADRYELAAALRKVGVMSLVDMIDHLPIPPMSDL